MSEREQPEKKSFLNHLNDQLDPANQGSWGEEPDSLPSYHDVIEWDTVKANEEWVRNGGLLNALKRVIPKPKENR